MRYTLKVFDIDLVNFSLNGQEKNKLKAEIIDVNDKYKYLLPLNLKLNENGIIEWLNDRVIPENRMFVDEILASVGLDINDTKGIIDASLGLSLNDSYWIVENGFKGKFADYNFFENNFSEDISLVAFTGAISQNAKFNISPEFTTNGMLRKAWRYFKNDGIYLYKGGTEGAANTGNEPFNEYYACQIAETMGLNFVPYELEYWEGILVSKCKLFTDINTSYIPIGRLLDNPAIKDCLSYYKKLGNEFYESLCSMIVFDSLICNEDRHFGNFGLLRDNNSGKIISTAPIFDNGLSLFNYAMPKNFNDLKSYAKTRPNPYDISYEMICKEIMGNRQKEQLKKLENFSFKRHPIIEWSEKRLTSLEKYIREKARKLLSVAFV